MKRVTEYQVCLTITPEKPEDLKAIEDIHSRLPNRPSGVKGLVWDASTGEASHTVGGERSRLTKIVGENVDGELLSIDQVGPSSINVAVIVEREEFFSSAGTSRPLQH